MNEEEKKEMVALVDELVAKGGPTTGQIKANQDPAKVTRLKELGWTSAKKELSGLEQVQEKLKELEKAQKKIQETLANHEKRIAVCSIQR